MAVVFAVLRLYNSFSYFSLSVHSSSILFFNLVLVNQMEWSVIPACHSLILFLILNKSNTEGTNSLKKRKCLMFVHVCFVYYCVSGLTLQIWFESGFTYMRRVFNCACSCGRV